MDRKTLGRLGEAATVFELTKLGMNVFRPVFDNGEIDLIAQSDQRLLRVSVKSTSTEKVSVRGWKVSLRSISRRKDRIAVKFFDNKIFEILAVYLHPADRVVLIDASKVSEINAITIYENDPRTWIMDPCENGNRPVC